MTSDIFLIYAGPVLTSGLIWFLLLSDNPNSNLKLRAFFRNIFGIFLGPTIIFFGYIELATTFSKNDIGIAYGSLFLLTGLCAFILLYTASYCYFKQDTLIKHMLSANVIALAILIPFLSWLHNSNNISVIILLFAAWLATCSFCSFIDWMINRLAVKKEPRKP